MNEEKRKTYKRLASIPLPHEAKITNDTHIGLIVPPSPFVVPCGWEWVHTAPFEGPSIIASVIKGLGYKFTLLDQRSVYNHLELKGKLNKFDIIGIATYEDNFPYIKGIIEIIKKENPKCSIILGGSLVTSIPELIMKNTKADYAVIGEGELTLIELLDFLSKNNHTLPIGKINGLVWRNTGGKIIINKPRKQMQNLDAVPFQDFSVWERFKNKDIPEIYLSYSRGCNNNCSFCFRTMPKLNYKSVERVKKEIDYLKRYNFKMVWWNDLTFITDKEYVHELLNKAFDTHQFKWCAFSRVTGIDLPTLKHMKKKGCNVILYGFESITQDILDFYNKGIQKNNIVNAINLTKKSGIKTGGLFIIGSQEETKESLKNIIDFCKKFKEVTRVKYLSAIPGTPLYKQAIKDGFIKDEIKHLYFLAREESVEEDIEKEGFLFFPKNISKADLKKAYRAVNRTIEKKPYDYQNEKDIFLKKPKKFKKRTTARQIY